MTTTLGLALSNALATQNAQGEAIERRIDGIARMAQENLAAVNDASEQAKGLSQVADDLSSAVSVFKI